MIAPLIPACEKFLHREEGCRLRTYDDHDGKPLTLVNGIWRRADGGECLGYPTIGWGRRIWPGETIQTCTQDQADAWFRARLATTDLPAVDRAWGSNKKRPPINPFQRGALTSAHYNAGTLGDLLSVFDKGGLEALKPFWCSWRIKSKGVVNAVLVGRRPREFALFATPMPEDESTIDVNAILSSIADTTAKMVAELPSLNGPILRDD